MKRNLTYSNIQISRRKPTQPLVAICVVGVLLLLGTSVQAADAKALPAEAKQDAPVGTLEAKPDAPVADNEEFTDEEYQQFLDNFRDENQQPESPEMEMDIEPPSFEGEQYEGPAEQMYSPYEPQPALRDGDDEESYDESPPFNDVERRYPESEYPETEYPESEYPEEYPAGDPDYYPENPEIEEYGRPEERDYPEQEEPEFDLEPPSMEQRGYSDYEEPAFDTEIAGPEEELSEEEQYGGEPDQQEPEPVQPEAPEPEQTQAEEAPVDQPQQKSAEEEPEAVAAPNPEQQKRHAAEEAKRLAKKSQRVARQGEAEFIGFNDPEINPAHVMVSKQEIQVKRAPTLEFADGGGEQAMAMGNLIFLGIVTVCCALAVVGTTVGGVFFYKLHKQHAAAAESDYPQFGVVGQSAKASSKRTAKGDQRMAYSAQLHHYQQTKQKIISLEQSGMDGQREHESEGSEDEADEGDYSVYECPGLAPTGDIEVSNPMFEKNKSGGAAKE